MKKFLKGEKGSYTFEAALLFPIYIIFIICLVLMVAYIFQIGQAKYMTSVIANDIAYNWNNPNKDLKTGEFDIDEYYSNGIQVYWRVPELVGIVDIAQYFPGNNGSGSKTNAGRTSVYNHNLDISIDTTSYFVMNEVTVSGRSSLYLPDFMLKILGKENITATTTVAFTDTPELVRTKNFLHFLWSYVEGTDRYQKVTEKIGKFIPGGE